MMSLVEMEKRDGLKMNERVQLELFFFFSNDFFFHFEMKCWHGLTVDSE